MAEIQLEMESEQAEKACTELISRIKEAADITGSIYWKRHYSSLLSMDKNAEKDLRTEEKGRRVAQLQERISVCTTLIAGTRELVDEFNAHRGKWPVYFAGDNALKASFDARSGAVVLARIEGKELVAYKQRQRPREAT